MNFEASIMNDSRTPGTMILLSYVAVRLTWEVYAFPITMSPLYAVLNISVLMPLFSVLLYQLYTGFKNRSLNLALASLCALYLAGYLALGLLVYPLMLTPRLEPKPLFIDIFTLWNTLFALIYAVCRLRRKYQPHKDSVKVDRSPHSQHISTF